MIYVAIDPSFSKTGVAILSNKTLSFYTISPPGTNVDYGNTVSRAIYISNNIKDLISDHLDLVYEDTVNVIVEEPLLTSTKASRLGILAGILSYSLKRNYRVSSLYYIQPGYVYNIGRPTKKEFNCSKKVASQIVAGGLLELLVASGFEIIIHNDKLDKKGNPKKRKLSHDESEAFIILTNLLINYYTNNTLEEELKTFIQSIDTKLFKAIQKYNIKDILKVGEE